MDVRVVLDGAARALSSTAGAPVRFAAPELLKSWERNDVWRCRVVDGPSRLPPSVIVKHFKSQPDRGFDDWASLEFLSSLALDPPVAPTFLAGDRAARVFVMADVGPGRTLEDLLLGGDAKAAVEGLVGVATQTARLHAATLQESQVFDRLRDRLASRAVTPMDARWPSCAARAPTSVVGSRPWVFARQRGSRPQARRWRDSSSNRGCSSRSRTATWRRATPTSPGHASRCWTSSMAAFAMRCTTPCCGVSSARFPPISSRVRTPRTGPSSAAAARLPVTTSCTTAARPRWPRGER